MALARHKTVQAVAATIRRHGLIPDGVRVIVAVSGGPDSVALASILNELAGGILPGGKGRGRPARSRPPRPPKFHLVLAHLNHGLRKTADRDQRHVAALARRLGLPLVTRRIDVAARARRRHVGIEEAARQARYEFFLRVARDRDAALVAVGHHCDDQAETVLMNFLRGAALRGLSGMPIRRPIAPDSPVTLIRPLLEVTREQVLAYLRARSLDWVEDETNRSSAMFRNRLRNELLPLLERDYVPGLRDRLNHMANHLAAVQDMLARRAAAAWDEAVLAATARSVELSVAALRREGRALTAEIVLAALEHLGAGRRDLSADHIEAAWRLVCEDRGERTVQLPAGVTLGRRADRLRIARRA